MILVSCRFVLEIKDEVAKVVGSMVIHLASISGSPTSLGPLFMVKKSSHNVIRQGQDMYIV